MFYRFWEKHRELAIPSFLVFMAFLLLTMQVKGQGQWLAYLPQKILAPLEFVITKAERGVNSLIDGIAEVKKLREENSQLRAMCDELSARVAELEAMILNSPLREILLYKEKKGVQGIVANVIGKDATAWYRTILLDKGAQDGVRFNMPVVTAQGLVGRVAEVFPSTCRVQLITDEESKIAVLVMRTREQGLLEGQLKRYCKLKYIPTEADLVVGDVILTSGLGGIFPKDVVVGDVVRVEERRGSLFKEAYVRPRVRFSRLETVLIVRRF